MTTTADLKILKKAHKRFARQEEKERDRRVAALDDLEFVYDVGKGQWPKEIRDERDADGRPCLTSNKLKKFVKQVANKERDQKLVGRVRPVDDISDPKIADIYEGLIRQIQYASTAEFIYADAGEKAAAGGVGYWRLTTKQLDDSFDQEIFIERIKNQFSVYMDEDREFCFVREKVLKEDFAGEWPDAAEESFDSNSVGDTHLWYDDDSVYIAEYWYFEKYNKEIAQVRSLVDPSLVKVVEITEDNPISSLKKQHLEIVVDSSGKQKIRKSPSVKVKVVKITGSQILERGDWAGDRIPIIKVVGDSVNIEGKEYEQSLIRGAKDPQRMYNFWISHNTEVVALAPKAPYMLKTDSIVNRPKWNSANKKNYVYLEYKGNIKPSRELPPQLSSGSASMAGFAANDIMDTVGMFESTFGERSNERTGIAIKQRASRSDFSVFHFQDNLRRAILETIKQIVYLIPRIYDTERSIRIIGIDEDVEDGRPVGAVTSINTPSEAPGILKNDLTFGKYDVIADTREWSTRRQESVEFMSAIASSMPNVAPLFVADLFKAYDLPGAKRIGDKIEANLPAIMGQQGPGNGGGTVPA